MIISCLGVALFIFLFIGTSGEENCRNILTNGANGSPSITRINRENNSCQNGDILWSNRLSSSSSHIVQFTKNHSPFSLCLHSEETRGFTMMQLKGKAKREIGRRGEPQCIQSHCNHVSLLIKTRKGSSFNKLSYSLQPSNDCARCSDSCMEKILCSSDYIFIGLVKKSSLLSDNSSLYKSSIEVHNYLRYNNSYTLDSGRNTCTRSPSQFALNSEYAIPRTGIVSVFSKCKLKEDQKYFIGSNLKLGYLSKPRLMLGCAQEDVNYMLYHLDKLLLHNTSTCC